MDAHKSIDRITCRDVTVRRTCWWTVLCGRATVICLITVHRSPSCPRHLPVVWFGGRRFECDRPLRSLTSLASLHPWSQLYPRTLCTAPPVTTVQSRPTVQRPPLTLWDVLSHFLPLPSETRCSAAPTTLQSPSPLTTGERRASFSFNNLLIPWLILIALFLSIACYYYDCCRALL